MLLRYYRADRIARLCCTRRLRRARSETPECGLSMTDEDALRDLWTMACQSPSMTGVGQ